MKYIFFGGNRLSVTVLEKLFEKNIKPSLVIASPDKPVGKKKTVSPPPLKSLADNLQLTTLQPVSLKKDLNIIKELKKLKPDLGIVVAYGRIIPKEIIDLFPKGVLNLHPSLLPKHRGASPIQTTLLENDPDTGVSIILLDEQMDHGSILTQEKIKLTGQEYFPELYEKLSELGGKLLTKTIPLWLENKITPRPQNDSEATVCKKLEWKDGKINFDDSCEKTFAKIRALGREPGAWVKLQTKNKEQKTLKIVEASPISLQITVGGPGSGLWEQNKELMLICPDGALLLERVQPEGKRIMTGKEFLNGYRQLIINNKETRA